MDVKAERSTSPSNEPQQRPDTDSEWPSNELDALTLDTNMDDETANTQDSEAYEPFDDDIRSPFDPMASTCSITSDLVGSPTSTENSFFSAASGFPSHKHECDGQNDPSQGHFNDFAGPPSPPFLRSEGDSSPLQSRSTPPRGFPPARPSPYVTKRPAHPLSHSIKPDTGNSPAPKPILNWYRGTPVPGTTLKTTLGDDPSAMHPLFSVTFSLPPLLSNHDLVKTAAIRRWMAKPHNVRFYHSAFHVLAVVAKPNPRNNPTSMHRLAPERKSDSDAVGQSSLFDTLQGAIVRMRWVDDRKPKPSQLNKPQRGPLSRQISSPDVQTERPSATTFQTLQNAPAADPSNDSTKPNPLDTQPFAAQAPFKDDQSLSSTTTNLSSAESGTSARVFQVDADVQSDHHGFNDAEDVVLIVRSYTASWFGDMAVGLVQSPAGLELKEHPADTIGHKV